MGRHLNTTLWFDTIVTAAGTTVLRRKRVSAKREKQFPRRYRDYYQLNGASKLCKKVMEDYHVGLAEAWAMVKRMFMDQTFECPPKPDLRVAVAYRHSFDGNGWLYIDNGHGSDWEDRAKRYPDAEPLYE